MSMSTDPARPPRDKKPSGWFQDFETSAQPRKRTSPELRGKPGGLPPRPPRSDVDKDELVEESEEVLLIPTQEEDERDKINPTQQAVLDQRALEEELNKTPGLAGLVELATTPVGTPMSLAAQPGIAPPALDLSGDMPDSERRVTIWNPYEKRKLSGNSAPFKKNLDEYLRKHPDWEEYWGQDLDENGRKLFPRKRRRASAEPSPAMSAQPDPGALSMMDGLLQLATEEHDKSGSPKPLGSLGQHSGAMGGGGLLGSVLDSVHSKVAAEFSQPTEHRPLSMVQGLVAEAIEDSCRETLKPAAAQVTQPGSNGNGLGSLEAGPLASVSSC